MFLTGETSPQEEWERSEEDSVIMMLQETRSTNFVDPQVSRGR